jgi:DNA polymerase-1
MKIINTSLLSPETMPRSQTERDLIYNGLDSCVTFEIADDLLLQFDEITGPTYQLSKDLLGPILEMNMRGVLIDVDARDDLLAAYGKDLTRMERQLRRIVEEGIGISPFNWRSNPNLIQLFYEALGIPPIRKRNAHGELVPTVNRDALERLKNYLYAKPIVSHLEALRGLGKKISFLRTGIDGDGRIRTSYNIGGTRTGRPSSSFSDFGTGTDLQNVEQRLRRIFIADPGYKFCNIDLEQSDSRAVGAIEWDRLGDPRYLDACESGDLHTTVARMTWPNLGWTGDLKPDRVIADQVFYRDKTYRFTCKPLGHGTNFLGGPDELHRHTGIPVSDIKEFQGAYFAAFPAHLRWHALVESALRDYGFMVTMLGRRRHFFGRRNDRETLKQAVAFEPQSITADTLLRAILRCWRLRPVELLLQVHDNLLVQYPEYLEDNLVPRLLEAFKFVHILRGGRKFFIPAEAKVGWNWADADEVIEKQVVRTNPDGLVKYSGFDPRSRQRRPIAPIMDRQFSRIHF